VFRPWNDGYRPNGDQAAECRISLVYPLIRVVIDYTLVSTLISGMSSPRISAHLCSEIDRVSAECADEIIAWLLVESFRSSN